MRFTKFLYTIVLTACFAGRAYSDVKMPSIISDNMVLTKSKATKVWGWAEPGEKVTVSLNGMTRSAMTSTKGSWIVEFDLSQFASGPFEMEIQGNNKLTISNVVVGHVWLASGQSNMEFELHGTKNDKEEISKSANDNIREFKVKKTASDHPLNDCVGVWMIAAPATSGKFSAVPYYFAKNLESELKAPVGIISTSWGGSAIEAWMSDEAFNGDSRLKDAKNTYVAEYREFPRKWNEFASALSRWLEKNDRNDKLTDEKHPTPPGESTDGWKAVKLPGWEAIPSSFGETGVFWLRRMVTLPAHLRGQEIRLDIPQTGGFIWVLLNGKLVATSSLADVQEYGLPYKFAIPGSAFCDGENEFLVRVFAPVKPINFFSLPRLGPLSLSGEWSCKVEKTFPPLTESELSGAPSFPSSPLAPQLTATFLYNGMIFPVAHYTIDGFIWYQGETNADRASQYNKAFPLLIQDWRSKWSVPNLPFYYCQLAAFSKKKTAPEDSKWAELREAQSNALKLENTAQVVLTDAGEADDIHPRDKRLVGDRLAQTALSETYKQGNDYSHAKFSLFTIEGSQIRIQFSDCMTGLVAKKLPETHVISSVERKFEPLKRNSPDSELEGFQICGQDKKWVWANARIEGNTVVVESPLIKNPIAVRYCWSDNPTGNLITGSGVPIAPFRTDDFPLSTRNNSY